MDALARARLSLVGLSVGDAFGETFFTTDDAFHERIRTRQPAPAPWRWTDDTAMAISIVEELGQRGAVNRAGLALRFADRFQGEPWRGYGSSAYDLLAHVAGGEEWQPLARGLFRGAGSHGNGGAMRVAPLGAFFADDLDALVAAAVASAEVTHTHPEGIAGAVAVAVAAAEVWRTQDDDWDRTRFLNAVLERTTAGDTRSGIEAAAALPMQTAVADAARALGSGDRVSAADTVPFALWCVAAGPDSFEETLWRTATGRGDVDTTCAMVGGITVLRTGLAGIPEAWLLARESLPELDLGAVRGN